MTEYCQIELTRGLVAEVSPEDFDELSSYQWRAVWDSGAKAFYAYRSGRKSHKETFMVAMHRQILDFPQGLHVDHINHKTLDNRRCNLRPCTAAQNQYNRGKSIKNTSGFKGVSLHSGKWLAGIKVNRKRHYLGRFSTPEAAHEAYCVAAEKFFGDFRKVA